jgi:putative redox protein
VVVDGDGRDGPSPMEMLLMSLAGCMGVDVVDILTKMRVPLGGLAVRVEADRRAEPPRRLLAVRLTYRVEGVPASDRGKLQRAIDLSRERYCSVLHSLQPDLDLDIRIEDG